MIKLSNLTTKRIPIFLLSGFFALCASSQTVGSIYRIVSTNTGKAMTNNGNYKPDAPIVMGELDTEDKSQMWALISDGSEGSYGLYNMGSKLSIDMALQHEKAPVNCYIGNPISTTRIRFSTFSLLVLQVLLSSCYVLLSQTRQ